MKNINFWNPPFKLSAHYVYDSEDQFCFQFDLRTGYYEEDEKIMKEVIDMLNSRTDRKVISKLDIIDGCKIHISDRPFITIRGWGRLTGCGGWLCLDPDTAKEIQDDFAKWIFNKLKKITYERNKISCVE